MSFYEKEVRVLKKLLSFVLALVMLISIADIALVSSSAAETRLSATGLGTIPTETEFLVKLNALRKKYPHGTSWEGVYREDGVAKAWTCHAYAVQMFYEVFGVQFYNSAFFNNKDYTFDNICAGDIVRINYNSHSIFITKVTSDKIYFTDGNYDNANGIRWDAYYTVSQLRSIFSYKYHLSGNTLTGNADLEHTIAYKANNGNGSVASEKLRVGGTLNLKKDVFTRDGYTCKGYIVKRAYDEKWYTKEAGWQSKEAVYDNGYTFYLFKEGASHSFGTGWTKGVTDPTTFYFYAQWLPLNSTVEFYANYSGFNYLPGSSLKADYTEYIKTTAADVYSLSVDTANRLNNADSLHITGAVAGAYGKEVRIDTTTNFGYGDGYTVAGEIGENMDMVLRFWAKSSQSGTNMYIHWKNQSANARQMVTLTDSWAAYTVPMNKNYDLGTYLLVSFDTPGEFYLNSLVLCEGTSASSVTPETAYKCAKSQTPPIGGCLESLPAPTREGYTFLGWFTRPSGGDLVTTDTPIDEIRLRLYAHWRQNESDTPVKTVDFGGHRYELYDTAMSWDNAKTFCKNKGGHLITIGSDDENAVAYDLIKDGQKFSWIGLSFNKSKNKWLWVDNKSVSYNKWYSSKEGTDTTTEYYAMMYSMNLGASKSGGKWADCNGVANPASFYGYLNSVFICEYDTVPTEPETETESTAEPTTEPTETVETSTDETAETGEPSTDETADPTAETALNTDETADPTAQTDSSADASTEESSETAEPTTEEPTEPPKIIGDADDDGMVSIFDATFIQRYLAHLKEAIPFCDLYRCMDVDDDGEITIFDATYIQQWLSKMTVDLPIGSFLLPLA